MKKTLCIVLFIAITTLIIVSSLSFVLAASELCRGVDGYYGDCSYEPYRYQASASAGASSGSTSSSSVFKGANAEVYQYKQIVRENRPIIIDNSPSYPVTTGAMPYFTGGYAGLNQGYGYGGYGDYGYGGYGYNGYDYGLGYDSYDYYGYGGYGNGLGYGNMYDYYGYGGYSGYGYGYPNAFDYGLGIASQYTTPEGTAWLGVASMVQQFFWI